MDAAGPLPELAADDDAFIGLDVDGVDDAVGAGGVVEGGVEGAVGVEPCAVVVSAEAGELAADNDFAIGLAVDGEDGVVDGGRGEGGVEGTVRGEFGNAGVVGVVIDF